MGTTPHLHGWGSMSWSSAVAPKERTPEPARRGINHWQSGTLTGSPNVCKRYVNPGLLQH